MRSETPSPGSTPNRADPAVAPVGGNLTLGLMSSVRTEILSGKWPLHARLPTDRALARAHGVGLNTVRRALGALVDEGLLERRRGSGTFVIGTPTPVQEAAPVVGILVPTTRRYFPDLIAGLESVVRSAGGHLLLRSTERDQSRELNLLDDLVAQHPTGLVVVPTLFGVVDPDVYLRRIGALDVPTVLAERVPTGSAGRSLSYVATDTAEGGRLAVEHLYGLGRRRIGLLSSRNTATSEQLLDGFRVAVAEYAMNSERAVARRPEWDEDDLASYARRARSLGLDAVVCLGDRNAAQLLPQLRRVGLTVPDDVAVVAYENEVARDAEIPLTTVEPPRLEVGRLAGELLLRQVELGSGATPVRVEIAPRLVVRSSTVPPA